MPIQQRSIIGPLKTSATYVRIQLKENYKKKERKSFLTTLSNVMLPSLKHTTVVDSVLDQLKENMPRANHFIKKDIAKLEKDVNVVLGIHPDLLNDMEWEGNANQWNDSGDFPIGNYDLFFHIASSHRDINGAVLDDIYAKLKHAIDIIHIIEGYLAFPQMTESLQNGKDLSLFEDGTENPTEEEERKRWAVTKQGHSFVLAQQWHHHGLDSFAKKPVHQQEETIGRSRLDSVEMDPLPDGSHVSRVTIEEDDEEQKIVRHSLPYRSSMMEKGLFFIGYSDRATLFNKQLASMAGFDEEGKKDHRDLLFSFSRVVSSNIMIVPSIDKLNEWRQEKSLL